MTMDQKPDIKLGLIGDNIAKSSAPKLHRLAGRQNGLHVQYDRLVPEMLEEDFDTVFEQCPRRGYRGINVTYPYKERAATKVTITDPLVREIGAVNTVVFDGETAHGFNTDYSGFITGYRKIKGQEVPGISCLIGSGGVGRALAFGLVALGASEIRLVDRDESKALALANQLNSVDNAPLIRVFTDAANAAHGATGLLNGTPVGMVGLSGTPLPREAMRNAKWAFDAVYTPVDTQFLQHAAAERLKVISGYELFFYQGIHAWTHFSGLKLDEMQLRRDLHREREVA